MRWVQTSLQVLEYVLSFGGLLVTYLLAKRRRCGWVLEAVFCFLWVVWAAYYSRWGMGITSVVYTILAVQGWRNWR
jgi:hypothetical protein